MFRKTKRVIASLVLACSVFSLTAFSPVSASGLTWNYSFWVRLLPAGIRLARHIGNQVNEDVARNWGPVFQGR